MAGILLWLMTYVLSRSNISGNGWSLSGNGALVIPFGVGPVVVAAGWTAVVLRMRAHPRWWQLAIGSGLLGLTLLLASVLSLVAFGAAGRDVGATGSLLFGLLLYAWLAVSPVVAAVIAAPGRPAGRLLAWSVIALLLIPVALIAGCEAGARALPT